MPTIDTVTAPAAAPNPRHPSWPDTLAKVRSLAANRLSTATIRLTQHIRPAVREQLDRLDTYCTLRPLHRAIARARFQVRAYAFDHEHRSTRLLAWAAALDTLAHTLRTIPSPVPPDRDSDRIEQVTNQAALLRAMAETDRVRHANTVDPASSTRRAPSTPDIEAAAAVQLNQLCRPTLTLAGRIALLNQLVTQLYPTLGHAVQVLRDLA
jgi:hypothetical protein